MITAYTLMNYSPQPMTKLERADKALAAGDFGLAIELAEGMLRQSQTDVDARRVLGGGLVMAGVHSDPPDEVMVTRGLGEIEKALIIDQGNPDVLYTRGVCFAQLGRFDEARDDFVDALAVRYSYRESSALVAACLSLNDYEAGQRALDTHIDEFAGPILVPLHQTEEDGRCYSFQKVSVAVSREDGLYAVDCDDLRIFGMADTLLGAFQEWMKLFHLSFTDFVDSDEPLAPRGVRYADQLRSAAVVTPA